MARATAPHPTRLADVGSGAPQVIIVIALPGWRDIVRERPEERGIDPDVILRLDDPENPA